MSHLLGQKISTDLSYDFKEVFRFQFVLSPNALDIPDFKFMKVGNNNLYFSDLLNVCEIQDTSGAPLGVILGQAFGPQGEYLHGVAQIETSQSAAGTAKILQSFVSALAGRFVAILDVPGRSQNTRVYVDTASSFSAVYDTTSGIVASSLPLCLNRDIHPNEYYRMSNGLSKFKSLAPYLPEQDPELSDAGLFFGQTPDKYVMRIMPNHYLDVKKLQLVRYWPVKSIEHDLDHRDAADILVSRLGQIMGSASHNLEGFLSISGGRDSRILLACVPQTQQPKLKLHCYATNWMTMFDGLCCTNPMKDSRHESSMIAVRHEQLVPDKIQDDKLVVIQ